MERTLKLPSPASLRRPPSSLFFFKPLVAPPTGRDGSKAVDSAVPVEGREEKQTEGILETIEDSDAVSQKAAQHDQTPLSQEADAEAGFKFIPPIILPNLLCAWLEWLRSESKRISEYMNTRASLHAAQDMGSNHRLILDSGSSIHSTGDLRLLSEFTRAPEGSAAVLRTRDGRDLPVAGEGTIACDKFHLPRVNYVPGLTSGFTLVSVQQLAVCDYLVMFRGGCCYVKNRSNGSLAGRGLMRDEDGFYHLEFLRIPPVAVEDNGVN